MNIPYLPNKKMKYFQFNSEPGNPCEKWNPEVRSSDSNSKIFLSWKLNAEISSSDSEPENFIEFQNPVISALIS